MSGNNTNGSNNLIPTLTLAAAGVAACSLLALTALQSDACSRRLLSAEQLHEKRQDEYRYQWLQALEYKTLQIQYYAVGNHKAYSAEEELLRTKFVTTDKDLQQLVDQIVAGKLPGLRVARIGKDGLSSSSSSNELFLWLIQKDKNEEAAEGTERIFRLPLQAFCLLLAKAMEGQIVGTTFCFVADASAAAASQFVVDLVQATTPDAVAVVREPFWMVQLAVLLQQPGLMAAETAERIFYSLCRLESAAAVAAHNPVGDPKRRVATTTTVLVTLPGQATTPTLLPLAQKAFPDDRHLFCYTGCVRTVRHANQQRRHQNSRRGYIPSSLEEALRMEHPVIHTTPLGSTASSSRRSALVRSTHVMEPIQRALAALSLAHADVVETWMTAVDAFFIGKEDEAKNGYLPYVCKLEYLLPNNNASSSASLEEGSDRYWSLLSLLQFVTGSRSRAMSTEQIDAAVSWLRDYSWSTNTTALPDAQFKAIENAVFEHKLILIENKTLKDTVQPAQHWTLKAAAKRGCACCLPEDDEDEEEEDLVAKSAGDDDEMGSRSEVLLGMTKRTNATKNTGYVDGKMGFAFDPTRFGT